MHIILLIAAVATGAIAAVTGFGIGSLLTPILAADVGTKLAVAAVAIPHFVCTAQRFWMLKQHLDRRLLVGFGIASAAGGLLGALLHLWVSSRALTIVFGILLASAGISELTGWMQRVTWSKKAAWVAGGLSGILGGMVGNQGGIRSAALLGFKVPKEAFVATATAAGLMVDVARIPVYLVAEWDGIVGIWPLILAAIVGGVLGTVIGTRLLKHMPQTMFRHVLGALLIVLGVYMIAQTI